MEEIVYLNGRLIPHHEAKLSVADYGFLYGYGLFETMRAYNGVVFRLDRHLDRLASAAAMLKIPVNNPALRRAVMETVQANQLTEARIRLTVSIGEGGMVPDLNSCGNPTIFVAAKPYVPYNPERYDKGFHLITSSIRRSSQSPLTQMKTANYLANLLSRQEALSSGADDALFLNEKNCVAETTTSNIFLSSNDVLKTPRVENGLLPGITRDVVIALAAQCDSKVLETDIQLEELLNADEVFITNSIIEVMPVSAINGKTINVGKQGLITRTIMNAYKDLVRKETSDQNR